MAQLGASLGSEYLGGPCEVMNRVIGRASMLVIIVRVLPTALRTNPGRPTYLLFGYCGRALFQTASA